MSGGESQGWAYDAKVLVRKYVASLYVLAGVNGPAKVDLLGVLFADSD